MGELLDAKWILSSSCVGSRDNNDDDDSELDYTHCIDELSLTPGIMQSVVDINNRNLYAEQRKIVGFVERCNDPLLQNL